MPAGGQTEGASGPQSNGPPWFSKHAERDDDEEPEDDKDEDEETDD